MSQPEPIPQEEFEELLRKAEELERERTKAHVERCLLALGIMPRSLCRSEVRHQT
jgi:hypothetical protein